MSLLEELDEMVAEVEKVERYFDEDGAVVVGWREGSETLAHFGSNTELARLLADIFVDALNEQRDAAFKAYCAGLEAFAWWKDGTQYVGTCGTCGTTLKDAIKRAELDFGIGAKNDKRRRSNEVET